VPVKLVHDYLVLPAWRLAQRLRSRPGDAMAGPQNGAR
jgi:hypothetical protein